MRGYLERIPPFLELQYNSLMEEKNIGGRPRLTPEQLAEKKSKLLQKIEPYLKTGLSVNKALHEAKIFNSEFYRYMREDEFFRDEVNRYKQYISVLVNQAIVTELFRIAEKQNGRETTQPLSKDDHKFLWWLALKHNSCKEEWGRRKNIDSFDPAEEIQRVKRLVEESTTQ